MTTHISADKGKYSVYIGSSSFILPADCNHIGEEQLNKLGQIDDLINSIVESINDYKTRIKVYVAYEPKHIREVKELQEETDGYFEEIEELSKKIANLIIIKNLLEDGYKIIYS